MKVSDLFEGLAETAKQRAATMLGAKDVTAVDAALAEKVLDGGKEGRSTRINLADGKTCIIRTFQHAGTTYARVEVPGEKPVMYAKAVREGRMSGVLGAAIVGTVVASAVDRSPIVDIDDAKYHKALGHSYERFDIKPKRSTVDVNGSKKRVLYWEQPTGRHNRTIKLYYPLDEAVVTEKWNDSGASDAKGRWAKYRDGEIGVGAMATWLYNSRVHKSTKAEKLKSAMGAISQQQNTSKLISAAKADALRAALKRKYGSSE